MYIQFRRNYTFKNTTNNGFKATKRTFKNFYSITHLNVFQQGFKKLRQLKISFTSQMKVNLEI